MIIFLGNLFDSITCVVSTNYDKNFVNTFLTSTTSSFSVLIGFLLTCMSILISAGDNNLIKIMKEYPQDNPLKWFDNLIDRFKTVFLGLGIVFVFSNVLLILSMFYKTAWYIICFCVLLVLIIVSLVISVKLVKYFFFIIIEARKPEYSYIVNRMKYEPAEISEKSKDKN